MGADDRTRGAISGLPPNEITRSITCDGDCAVIRIPLSDVHALRVALRPVRAGETVSLSTQAIRDNLDKALARLQTKGT